MDPSYGGQEQNAYGSSRDEGRSSRDHRDYEDRERRHRERDGDRDHHRSGSGRDDRDRGYDRDRRDRGDRGDRDGDRGYGGDRDRRRRRDDEYGGGGYDAPPSRRPRYDENEFVAQPMRGDYDYPPPPRRDGPPRDDRRGRDDRRDGGRDGRDGGRGGRKASPPRSPTPEGAIPLERRVIEKSLWDIKPKGYEGIGAMEAKMTGLFTYGPGRNPAPTGLGIPNTVNFYTFPSTPQVNAVRAAKRVYIAEPTRMLSEDGLRRFFNDTLKARGWKSAEIPGEAVKDVTVDMENKFAFVEFRTPDEANAAMGLDGEDVDGHTLKLKPTKEFIGIDPALGDGSSFGEERKESPNKLFIGGLPPNLTEEQIMELLKSFGEVKTFQLIKDGELSRGFAFAEYIDSQATEMAIAGLNHFELGDRTLTVSRADVSRNSSSVAGMGMVAQSILAQTSSSGSRAPPPTSRVMLLLNMVTPDELRDDEEYAEILEDIKEEAGKFGALDDGPMGGVRIPRPQKKDKRWNAHITGAAIEARNRMLDEQNGVGRVYVKYKDARSTQKGMEALGGRQFGGRTILVASVPERDFDRPEEKAPIADIEGAPPANGAENGNGNGNGAEAAPPPPPPVDMDQAAADALKDIMG